MAVTVREVLKADLVLVGVELLKSQTEIGEFQRALRSDVLIGSATVPSSITGAARPVTALALQRDRIFLQSFPDRSVVSKEFPSLDDPTQEWARLAEVTTYAIANTNKADLNPRAFGYNLASVYDINLESSAASFLGDRMLTDTPLGNTGWELIGGAGAAIFKDGNRRWTFNLQPQPVGDPDSKRIGFDLNLHLEEPRIPTQDEISDTLNEIWTEARRFIERLCEVE